MTPSDSDAVCSSDIILNEVGMVLRMVKRGNINFIFWLLGLDS